MYKINLVALVTLSTLVIIATSQPAPVKIHYDIEKAATYFEDFIKEHNRVYKDDADKELHFQAFIKNLQSINELNEKSPSAAFGINKFSDYTNEEKQQMTGLGPIPLQEDHKAPQ